MQVLRAVGRGRQEEFQGFLDSMVGRLADRVASALGVTSDDAWALVAHLLNYAMGLWPIVARRYGYGEEAARAFSGRYAPFVKLVLG